LTTDRVLRSSPRLIQHPHCDSRHCDPPAGGEAIRRISSTQNNPPTLQPLPVPIFHREVTKSEAICWELHKFNLMSFPLRNNKTNFYSLLLFLRQIRAVVSF